MAADHSNSDYVHGEMDISMHEGTFRGFMTASKWLSLVTLAVVLWATLAFAVGIGWLISIIPTVIFMVAGAFFVKFFFPDDPHSH